MYSLYLVSASGETCVFVTGDFSLLLENRNRICRVLSFVGYEIFQEVDVFRLVRGVEEYSLVIREY